MKLPFLLVCAEAAYGRELSDGYDVSLLGEAFTSLPDRLIDGFDAIDMTPWDIIVNPFENISDSEPILRLAEIGFLSRHGDPE